jgi:hypothetical protein
VPFREPDHHGGSTLRRDSPDLCELRALRIASDLVEVAVRVATQVELGEDRDICIGIGLDRLDCSRRVSCDIADPATELRN